MPNDNPLAGQLPSPTRPRSAPALRLGYALVLVLTVTATGMLGYHFIEGWPLLDSLYMTVLTLTTIGYGVPHPLSYRGTIFTIAMMVSSIGIVGYSLSTVAAFLFEGELNRFLQVRRMDQRITRLSNHIILCGCGRTGIHIAEEFRKTHTPFVVVDREPDKIEHMRAVLGDVLYLHGDATQDEVLRTARIEQAAGLVAALGDDKENLFIVLTARSLNPTLRIITRANEDENIAKLRRAGADEVVSPNAVGGLRMASVMLRPAVVTFLDQMLRVPDQTLRIEEVHINATPSLIGKTLLEANIPQRTGLLVVAIIASDGSYRFNPRADSLLHAGDTLIVMGTPEQRETFRSLR
jgi:voltage-gated potassium channel